MERSFGTTKNMETTIFELSRKVNYLLTKMQNDIDLSSIEKQIKEILELINELDLETVHKLINELREENIILSSKVAKLKIDVDKNTSDIQVLILAVAKINEILEGVDLETLQSAVKFIIENEDELIEIIEFYKLMKEEGMTNEILLFYIKEYPTIQKIVSTFQNTNIDVTELASQMKYMKDAMQVENMKNTYFDVINDTNPMIPLNIFEFTSTLYQDMQQRYRMLPPIDAEVSDLRYPQQACMLIEVNRNTVISSGEDILFSKTNGNTTLIIQERGDKIVYSLTVLGDEYKIELDQFKIIGSANFTYLPNYKYHLIVCTLNDVLKKTYTLSVITGNADLNENEISVSDVVITDTFPPNHWIVMTNNLMFQTTVYASYENVIFSENYDIFKKMYVSSVLENVAYQTEKTFNELYTNQVTNNLYGQSTAISISKILSLLGTVPRLKDVEYTLTTDTVSSPSQAYLDDVTSWMNSQQIATPSVVYTPMMGTNTTQEGYQAWAYERKCASWNTLFEQNGKFYANLNKTLYEKRINKFELKQAYEDGSRIVEAWFEDVWENTELTSTDITKLSIYNSNGEVVYDDVSQDQVEIAFQMNPNQVAPRIMYCRITALTNNLKTGSLGIKLDHTVKTNVNTYMYIQPGNISTESSNKLTGTIELNGETKNVIFTPYTYANSNSTTSFVYRAQVSSLIAQTRIFTTTAIFHLKNTTRNAYVAIDKQVVPTMEMMMTEYYNGPINDTPGGRGYFMHSYIAKTNVNSGLFSSTTGTWTDDPEYELYDDGYILNAIAVRPNIMASHMLKDYPTYMCEWYAVPEKMQPGINNVLDVIKEDYVRGTVQSNKEYRTLRYSKNSKTWTWVYSSMPVKNINGTAILNPQAYFGYTSTTVNDVTNLILKGQEIVLPIEFNQTSIPDYILTIKNDVAYLAAYAEYLKALIDNLDERVTLVENTVDELVSAVNDIISALTPKQRSFGGQILSFCGTAIGMFFPLTGLAVSIVGQMYEGGVQLKQGNLVTGIMDLATGAVMSALGIRKFKQRMDRKYGTREELSNQGLPTYDELYGPPGYGSDNVRNDLSIGRQGDSNLIKSGTLRNTIILNDDSSNVKLETWLYRTNYGWESPTRSDAKTLELNQSRAIRVTESWQSKQLISIIYEYIENTYTEYETNSNVLSNETFQVDYGTKLTIEQFGKMLFAKTRPCISEAEGFGFDSEVFCMFMYSLSQQVKQTQKRNKLLGRSMIIRDKTVVPFRNKIMNSDGTSGGLNIIDFQLALTPTISNEVAQTKILDSVYDFITMPTQISSMVDLWNKGS